MFAMFAARKRFQTPKRDQCQFAFQSMVASSFMAKNLVNYDQLSHTHANYCHLLCEKTFGISIMEASGDFGDGYE